MVFCLVPGILFLREGSGVLKVGILSCYPETLSQPPWVILESLGNSGSQPRRKTGKEMLERRALGLAGKLTWKVPN